MVIPKILLGILGIVIDVIDLGIGGGNVTSSHMNLNNNSILFIQRSARMCQITLKQRKNFPIFMNSRW
jgi:hypothetical protein